VRPGRGGGARHLPAAVVLPGRRPVAGAAGGRGARARRGGGARHRDPAGGPARRRAGVGPDRGRGRRDGRGHRGPGALPGGRRARARRRARPRARPRMIGWYERTIQDGGRAGAFWLLLALLITFLIVRAITRRIR